MVALTALALLFLAMYYSYLIDLALASDLCGLFWLDSDLGLVLASSLINKVLP